MAGTSGHRVERIQAVQAPTVCQVGTPPAGSGEQHAARCHEPRPINSRSRQTSVWGVGNLGGVVATNGSQSLEPARGACALGWCAWSRPTVVRCAGCSAVRYDAVRCGAVRRGAKGRFGGWVADAAAGCTIRVFHCGPMQDLKDVRMSKILAFPVSEPRRGLPAVLLTDDQSLLRHAGRRNLVSSIQLPTESLDGAPFNEVFPADSSQRQKEFR